MSLSHSDRIFVVGLSSPFLLPLNVILFSPLLTLPPSWPPLCSLNMPGIFLFSKASVFALHFAWYTFPLLDNQYDSVSHFFQLSFYFFKIYLNLFLFIIIFFTFFLMKFIVKLISIQHPGLIPTGALLSAHHPLSPPPTPHQPSVCSQYLRVSYGLPPSLSVTFSPLPLPHGLLLSFSGSHKSENIWYLSFSV